MRLSAGPKARHFSSPLVILLLVMRYLPSNWQFLVAPTDLWKSKKFVLAKMHTQKKQVE
jgi:hypothetical protein